MSMSTQTKKTCTGDIYSRNKIVILLGLPPGIVVTARGSQARNRRFDPRWELQIIRQIK
jgi:hypothetical protein